MFNPDLSSFYRRLPDLPRLELPSPRKAFEKLKGRASRAAADVARITRGFSNVVGSLPTKGVPYVAVATSPLHLFVASDFAAGYAEMAWEALKARKVAQTFFYSTRVIETLAFAAGDIGAGVWGGVTIANGMKAEAIGGALFSTMLPVLVLIGGVIGVATKSYMLKRNAENLHQYNEHLKRAQNNTRELVEFLEFLRGPQEGHEFDRLKFQAEHFTSSERQQVIIDRMIKLYQTLEPDLHQSLFHETLDEGMREMLARRLNENSEALEKARDLADLGRSELHRLILYNAIFLTLCAMAITSGSLLLVSPDYAAIAGGLLLGSGALELCYLIFDSKVDHDQFLRFEHYFRSLHRSKE